MARKKCFLACLIYCLLACTNAFTQPGVTDSVRVLYSEYIQRDSGQTVVLTSGRSVYLGGEKIWFRASVVHTDKNLDLETKNLFADLVTDKDSVVAQLVLDNRNLRTAGAFFLPPDMSTGIYWLRCYTASALTGSLSSIDIHPVYVLNKQSGASIDPVAIRDRRQKNIAPLMHFFAERLTALPGIISTGVIGLKDAEGSPLSVSGAIVASQDSLVTSFTTNKLGLCRLAFINSPTERYAILVRIGDSTFRYPFPGADANSMQLSIGRHTEKAIKAIVTLEEGLPENTRSTLMALQGNQLLFAAVGSGSYGVSVPLDQFSEGIARLLLFNASHGLVSERKFYVAKKNTTLQVTADRNKYDAREKATIQAHISAPYGGARTAILSASVENEWIQQLSDSIGARILPPSNDLLLDSWITTHQNQYSIEEIDQLMVARSGVPTAPAATAAAEHRRFEESLKLDHLTGQILSEKGRSVSGRIVRGTAIRGDSFFTDVDTTDQDGRFTLKLPQAVDSLKLSLQVTDKRHGQTFGDSIYIERFQFPRLPTPAVLKQQYLLSNARSFALLKRYHVDGTTAYWDKGWLTPVTIRSTKKVPEDAYASKRLNWNSRLVTSDKFRLGGFNAVGNALLMVPGVSLAFGDISILGPGFDLHGHVGRPLVIMDGVELPGAVVSNVLDFLNTLSAADIDFIEVLGAGEAAMFGIRGGNGVISINTRHGADRIEFIKSNTRVIAPLTYHVCPPFDMPDYSNPKARNNSVPDPRTTIYWTGNILTDQQGDASFSFFTADQAANYTIIITATTLSGEILSQRLTISNTGKRH